MVVGKNLPLGMHGDGGSFSKHFNLYVLSWNSLLGDGSTSAQRFISTVVRDSDLTAGALNSIFEVMALSFSCLFRGVRPTEKCTCLGLARVLSYVKDIGELCVKFVATGHFIAKYFVSRRGIAGSGCVIYVMRVRRTRRSHGTTADGARLGAVRCIATNHEELSCSHKGGRCPRCCF